VSYDSRPDTYEHIGQVRERILECVKELLNRAHHHDESKLVSPEVEVFDQYPGDVPSYGTREYDDFREGQQEALKHHYGINRHHPEHHFGQTSGMNLLDVIEMLADWKAATLRHPDGDLGRSIDIAQDRYGFGYEFKALLRNTAKDLGWL
jgi:hypothetical protein